LISVLWLQLVSYTPTVIVYRDIFDIQELSFFVSWFSSLFKPELQNMITNMEVNIVHLMYHYSSITITNPNGLMLQLKLMTYGFSIRLQMFPTVTFPLTASHHRL